MDGLIIIAIIVIINVIIVVIVIMMMKTCAVPRYDSIIGMAVDVLLVGKINSLSCLNINIIITCETLS